MTTTTESTLALEWPFHMLLSKHDDSMTPQTLLIQQKNIIHSQTTNPIWTGEVHYINPSVFFVPFGKAFTTPGASEMPSLLFCTLFRRTSFAVRSIFWPWKTLLFTAAVKNPLKCNTPRKSNGFSHQDSPYTPPEDERIARNLKPWCFGKWWFSTSRGALETLRLILAVHFPGSKVEAENTSELPRSKPHPFFLGSSR